MNLLYKLTIPQETKYQNIISIIKFKIKNGGAVSKPVNPATPKLFIGPKYNGQPLYPYVRFLENKTEIAINIKNKITFAIVGLKNFFQLIVVIILQTLVMQLL